jgi:hypothetical protein
MTTTQTDPEIDPSSPEWGALVSSALEQTSNEERSRSSLDGNPAINYFRYALGYYYTDGSLSNGNHNSFRACLIYYSEPITTSHGHMRGDFTVEFFRYDVP